MPAHDQAQKAEAGNSTIELQLAIKQLVAAFPDGHVEFDTLDNWYAPCTFNNCVRCAPRRLSFSVLIRAHLLLHLGCGGALAAAAAAVVAAAVAAAASAKAHTLSRPPVR